MTIKRYNTIRVFVKSYCWERFKEYSISQECIYLFDIKKFGTAINIFIVSMAYLSSVKLE